MGWLVAFLAQWPLVANPGYFSHDELEWGSFAAQTPVPWVSWLDIGAFQYRPLTFNLWLWLSRRLFDTPQLFHALLVAWGAGNATLLCGLARRVGRHRGGLPDRRAGSRGAWAWRRSRRPPVHWRSR